jgi:hypothetical protein
MLSMTAESVGMFRDPLIQVSHSCNSDTLYSYTIKQSKGAGHGAKRFCEHRRKCLYVARSPNSGASLLYPIYNLFLAFASTCRGVTRVLQGRFKGVKLHSCTPDTGYY